MEPIQIHTDELAEKQTITVNKMNPNVSYDSSFNNAAPTPIVSRAGSKNDDTYDSNIEEVKIENTQIQSNVNSMSEDYDEDDDIEAPIEPIGGILTKYKKSGLLFKPRNSYVSQNSPNIGALELQNIDLNKDDQNFEKNLNENDYEIQAPLSVNVDGMNNNNLSPKFSPKSDRRGSNMSTREFNYKGRRSSKRSSQISDRVSVDEDVKNNSKIRTVSDSSVNQNHKQRYMNSLSSASGLSDFGLNNQQIINNKTSVISTDIIDENKEICLEPQDFDINIHVKPNHGRSLSKTNIIKDDDDKSVSRWEYFAIFVSSITTWIFYNLYTGFYNWNDEIKEFNSGLPSSKWNKKYLLLVVVYIVFIWTNMAFNPFYFSYFRKLSKSLSSVLINEEYDINSKKGMIRISLIRFWVICAVIYCIIMTTLCIVNYNDYSVRLAQLTVVYVIMPPLITNVIISGYLLKRQAGIFIASHSIAWILSIVFIFFLFNGYDAKSLHLTYFFIVSIGSFCVYLIAAVCIKAGILIKESDLRRELSVSPKNIRVDGNGMELDPTQKSNESTSNIEQLQVGYNNNIIKDKYKGKPISCCCNRFQLELKMFFKIESLISALTFWSFWGVVSISDRPKYDTITELVFVISCCWWNPMFYSTTKRASKSINKYILNSYFIFGAFIGILQCFIFSLYWYIKVTYGKNIGINGENGLHIKILHSHFVLHEQNIRYLSFFLSFIVSFIFYFPATGYLFYRSPIYFGLSHLFFATMAVFIPLAITSVADRNIIQIDDTVFGIKFITDEFDRDIQNKKVTVIILYMVVFAMFLSLSGFSCTYFRFKKVLVESQAIVTGYKALQYRLEYPMTLTMFITLMMAFGDIVTDILFAFFEVGLKSWIKLTARTLFVIQMLLQLFSLQSVIMKVRGQLIEKHSKHQLRYFREWLYEIIPYPCGKFGIIIIYPFAWSIYYILLIIISLILSATKTISVRQVQQWWLSLIVVNYKRTANKKFQQHTKTQKEIKEKLETINKYAHTQQQIDNNTLVYDYFYDQYSNNINDNRLGLNDIHAVYWAELDKMYVKQSDGQQKRFNDDHDLSSSEGGTSDTIDSHHNNNINDDMANNGYNSDDNIMEQHLHHNDNNNNNNNLDEYDENYDPRFDDDNISMRIQKINRKRQNTKLNKERAEKEKLNKKRKKHKKRKKKKKRKRKKKKKKNNNNSDLHQFDKVWLGWKLSDGDLGIIFRIYLFVDKYTPKWMRHLYINANVYNTYFLTELIVESLPQCILIITNAYLKNDWTPISIASIFFSGGMIIYNVAKIVYYVGYLNKDMRSVVL